MIGFRKGYSLEQLQDSSLPSVDTFEGTAMYPATGDGSTSTFYFDQDGYGSHPGEPGIKCCNRFGRTQTGDGMKPVGLEYNVDYAILIDDKVVEKDRFDGINTLTGVAIFRSEPFLLAGNHDTSKLISVSGKYDISSFVNINGNHSSTVYITDVNEPVFGTTLLEKDILRDDNNNFASFGLPVGITRFRDSLSVAMILHPPNMSYIPSGSGLGAHAIITKNIYVSGIHPAESIEWQLGDDYQITQIVSPVPDQPIVLFLGKRGDTRLQNNSNPTEINQLRDYDTDFIAKGVKVGMTVKQYNQSGSLIATGSVSSIINKHVLTTATLNWYEGYTYTITEVTNSKLLYDSSTDFVAKGIKVGMIVYQYNSTGTLISAGEITAVKIHILTTNIDWSEGYGYTVVDNTWDYGVLRDSNTNFIEQNVKIGMTIQRYSAAGVLLKTGIVNSVDIHTITGRIGSGAIEWLSGDTYKISDISQNLNAPKKGEKLTCDYYKRAKANNPSTIYSVSVAPRRQFGKIFTNL